MQLELYNALKTQIETLQSIQYVSLWNNQFAREEENVTFGFPCVFIEFTNINYTDFLQGNQKYQMDVNIHIGFQSKETDDTDILQLKQDVQAVIHFFQQGYNTKMLRRSEIQNYDHDNVQEYIITYAVSGKDYTTDQLPSTDADVDTLDITLEPHISNHIINTDIPL